MCRRRVREALTCRCVRLDGSAHRRVVVFPNSQWEEPVVIQQKRMYIICGLRPLKSRSHHAFAKRTVSWFNRKKNALNNTHKINVRLLVLPPVKILTLISPSVSMTVMNGND